MKAGYLVEDGVAIFPKGITEIENYAFYNCSGLTSVIIPDSVTSIGTCAFSCCSGLTSVIIPDSVTSIGTCAFWGCSNLTSVIIPDSVISIGQYAFYNCTSLTSVVIPDRVTSIGDYVFYACIGLTSVIIPDSVTSIGDNTFKWCIRITALTIANKTYQTKCVDGLLTIIYNERQHKEYTIYKAAIFENMSNKNMCLTPCYVAQLDEVCAHGKTLKAAIKDLKWKLAEERGQEQYADLTKDSILSLEDAKLCYHVITGSCSIGIDNFVNMVGAKEQYTIAEIIKLTKGNYGGDLFEQYFNKE